MAHVIERPQKIAIRIEDGLLVLQLSGESVVANKVVETSTYYLGMTLADWEDLERLVHKEVRRRRRELEAQLDREHDDFVLGEPVGQ